MPIKVRIIPYCVYRISCANLYSKYVIPPKYEIFSCVFRWLRPRTPAWGYAPRPPNYINSPCILLVYIIVMVVDVDSLCIERIKFSCIRYLIGLNYQVDILPNYINRISCANLNSKFVIRLSMKYFPVYDGGSSPGSPPGATPPDPLNIRLPYKHIHATMPPHHHMSIKIFKRNDALY